METLAKNTEKLFTHPFTVSNAVIDIQNLSILLNTNVSKLLLEKDNLTKKSISDAIKIQEKEIKKKIDIVNKYYLGSKSDIQILKSTFEKGIKIREKVFALDDANQFNSHQHSLKNEILLNMSILYNQIETLRLYAFAKANFFYNQSVKNNGTNEVIFFFIFTVVISSFIIIYITTSLLKVSKENNHQLKIIDQNILTAKFRIDGKILSISKAFSDVLNQPVEALLNSKEKYFFIQENFFTQVEKKLYEGIEFSKEVILSINKEDIWFEVKFSPEIDTTQKVESVNIFYTNIDDKKKIEKLSITDKLTKLYNRNHFEQIFKNEVNRASRRKEALSAIMLDVDYFKQFNDTYGHQEGDYALQSVSKVLLKNTQRSSDYAFRVGGEEFVVLLYAKDFSSLEKFTQNLLQQVERLQIKHKGNKVSSNLTISAGVAMFKGANISDTDEIYKIIDNLLYQAKRDGRNKFKSKNYMESR